MTRFERQMDRIIGLKFRTETKKFTVFQKMKNGKYMIKSTDDIDEYFCVKEVIEVNYKKFGGWE